MSRNRHINPEPNSNLKHQVLKVGFKRWSHIFGLSIFLKNKTEKITVWVSVGNLSIFFIDAVKRIHNTFQIRGDKTQRQTNYLKTKFCR